MKVFLSQVRLATGASRRLSLAKKNKKGNKKTLKEGKGHSHGGKPQTNLTRRARKASQRAMWHAKILNIGVRFYYCSPQARDFFVLLGFVVFFAYSESRSLSGAEIIMGVQHPHPHVAWRAAGNLPLLPSGCCHSGRACRRGRMLVFWSCYAQFHAASATGGQLAVKCTNPLGFQKLLPCQN